MNSTLENSVINYLKIFLIFILTFTDPTSPGLFPVEGTKVCICFGKYSFNSLDFFVTIIYHEIARSPVRVPLLQIEDLKFINLFCKIYSGFFYVYISSAALVFSCQTSNLKVLYG